MLIILKYPMFTLQKYDSANNAVLEAKTLFYEHVNIDSTGEGLTYDEVITARVSETAWKAIIIRQYFMRLKL
jgi:hypothetical protein